MRGGFGFGRVVGLEGDLQLIGVVFDGADILLLVSTLGRDAGRPHVTVPFKNITMPPFP
jgi:hypothetical protein